MTFPLFHSYKHAAKMCEDTTDSICINLESTQENAFLVIIYSFSFLTLLHTTVYISFMALVFIAPLCFVAASVG